MKTTYSIINKLTGRTVAAGLTEGEVFAWALRCNSTDDYSLDCKPGGGYVATDGHGVERDITLSQLVADDHTLVEE